MTHKPKQRESLFSSEEEKQAEIERLDTLDRQLTREMLAIKMQLEFVNSKREELKRRVQELQNLDIFEDRKEGQG